MTVETTLNLPGMKVLNCQAIEGMGLIIEIEAEVKYSNCPKSVKLVEAYIRIIGKLFMTYLGVASQCYLKLIAANFYVKAVENLSVKT